jgi:erythromycin esterase-like protein
MLEESMHYAVLVIALFCLPAHAESASVRSGDEVALVAATHALCHRRVAMLGESATHEDGHTHAFKVALVERLIDRCGFDSVLFEASHYEFIDLNRRLRIGQALGNSDVLSAVGGVWEFNQEFRPLAPFLLTKAQAGQVFLGGMDDQLGQFGQDYANNEMVTELTNPLPEKERQACSTALHKRIYNDYTEATPYSKSNRAQIESCLSEMDRANAADRISDDETRTERQEMISAAQRCIGRDFTSDAEYMPNRDRSMFQNFEWLRKQQPKRHKVIIWAATVHVAKQGDPTWGDRTGTNFGSLVHQRYGSHAFSLGFSSLTGFYRQGRRGIKQIPPAPPNSVEAQACCGKNDAVYVGAARLDSMGTVPGAFFRHSYQTLRWSAFVDGLVIFHEGYPPADVRGK